ncbi:WbqC family protein [Streptomyces albospinus]|uniref:WbqC family protein n=1 Tax=Streptomyces albospinus TaxID=285515 RepID=UPI001E49CFAA|nr:WbqC family protein [Streptomyces albospinus]
MGGGRQDHSVDIRQIEHVQQPGERSPHWPVLAQALEPIQAAFDTGRTAAVAETSARVLLDLLGWQGQILASSRLAARPGRSQRLADLAAITGARSYLCGTGGMTYLDTNLFTAQAITVTPFLTPTAGIWTIGRRGPGLQQSLRAAPRRTHVSAARRHRPRRAAPRPGSR